MDIIWGLNARSFFDQLDSDSRSKILAKILKLAESDGWVDSVAVQGEPGLFRLAVPPDFRIFFNKDNGQIRIVDILRRSQFDYFQRSHPR